ncbi:MAG: hypothetical protein IJ202_08905 [Bacteroidales bacterium]|nr:hypothetical protein [Bacteroidales bacterium]
MKYIDAEKLVAKINELNLVTKTYDEQVAFNNALAMVVEIIDSLQQEQPEKTLTFDGFVDKVGTWFAHLRLDKFRKTFNGEIFPATQLVQEYDLFVRELSKTYSDKQEQPEVDCHELEEAADDNIRKVADAAGHPGWDWTTQDVAEAFKAGAKWQYQKDRYEFAKLKTKVWCDGYDDAVSQFVKISYEPRDWFSSKDGDFICGASFDEAIPAKVELYYRRRTRNGRKNN